MRSISVIKHEFKRFKNISGLHVIIAVSVALLMSIIAFVSAPLEADLLTPMNWVLAILTPFAALFFFYALTQKPMRSVFWFVKWLYCIAAPAIPVLLTGLFFDPNKSEMYSERFYAHFLPLWTAIWWLGIIAVYVILRLAELAARRDNARLGCLIRVIYAVAVMLTPQKTISRQNREGKSKWAVALLCMLMIALGVFTGTVALYLYCVYTNMEFEAILFTMTFAAGGLAIEDIIAGTAIFLTFAGLTIYFCFHLLKCFRNDRLVVVDDNSSGKYTLVMNGKKRALLIVMSAAMMFGGTAVFSAQTGFLHYVDMKLEKSDIYEEYYVKPDNSVVTFPDNKRNLIFIYVESMENTYASVDEGGILERNYISELTELTKDKDSVSFSNTQKLGGASVFVPSITFTMGSTVAQTSGISLNTKLFPVYDSPEFPDMIRLEDILHDNGYQQLYIEGSKGEFSMYDKYVGRYEDSRTFDRKTAADQGYIDENADYMWKWGIEDHKLFEITKELVTDMSKKDKPFFVTMYTMDTHSFESGHRCSYCDKSIKNDYLASVDCSSRQTAEFVNWVKQQPFYENTTVILVGDHLGNKKTSKIDINNDFKRTTYNCIINPAKMPENMKDRIFSSLDMFPTTLSAIGARIKGDRLGLGTDLFSNTQTLCEELGVDEYKLKLEQDSDYYEKEFYKSKH